MSHIKDKAAFELKQRGYEVDECICGWPKAATEPRCSKCMDQPRVEEKKNGYMFISIRAPYCPFGMGIKKAESVCREKGCALWDHDGDRCYFITGIKWLGDLAISSRIGEASSNVTFRHLGGDNWEARAEIRGATYVGNGKDQATAKAALMRYLEHIGEKVGS